MANFWKGFSQSFRPQEIAQFLVAYQDKLEERRRQEELRAQQREAERLAGLNIMQGARTNLQSAQTWLSPEMIGQLEKDISTAEQNPDLTLQEATRFFNIQQSTIALERQKKEEEERRLAKMREELRHTYRGDDGRVYGVFSQADEQGKLKVWISTVKDADGNDVIIPQKDVSQERNIKDLQEEYKNNITKLWGDINRPEKEYTQAVGQDYVSRYASNSLRQTTLLGQLGQLNTVRNSAEYKAIYTEAYQLTQQGSGLTVAELNNIIKKHTANLKPDVIANIGAVVVTDILNTGYKLKGSAF